MYMQSVVEKIHACGVICSGDTHYHGNGWLIRILFISSLMNN